MDSKRKDPFEASPQKEDTVPKIPTSEGGSNSKVQGFLKIFNELSRMGIEVKISDKKESDEIKKIKALWRPTAEEDKNRYLEIKIATHLLGYAGVIHVNDSDSKPREILGEGNTSDFSRQLFCERLKKEMDSDSLTILPDENKKIKSFIASLEETGLNNKLRSHLKKTKGVLDDSKSNQFYSSVQGLIQKASLLIYQKFPNHAVYSYIYKEGNSIFLIHCNRGSGIPDKPNKSSDNLKYELKLGTDDKLIKKVVFNVANVLFRHGETEITAPKFYDKFIKMVDQVGFQEVGGADVNPQKIGNCSVADLKAIMKDLVSPTTYKALTSKMRIHVIDELVEKIKVDDLKTASDIAHCAELTILLGYVKKNMINGFVASLEGSNRKYELVQHIITQLSALYKSCRPGSPFTNYLDTELSKYQSFMKEVTDLPQEQLEAMKPELLQINFLNEVNGKNFSQAFKILKNNDQKQLLEATLKQVLKTMADLSHDSIYSDFADEGSSSMYYANKLIEELLRNLSKDAIETILNKSKGDYAKIIKNIYINSTAKKAVTEHKEIDFIIDLIENKKETEMDFFVKQFLDEDSKDQSIDETQAQEIIKKLYEHANVQDQKKHSATNSPLFFKEAEVGPRMQLLRYFIPYQAKDLVFKLLRKGNIKTEDDFKSKILNEGQLGPTFEKSR